MESLKHLKNIIGNMYSVKCDYCDQQATTFDRQHLCIKHSMIRDKIRKSRNKTIEDKNSGREYKPS
jgi:ribosomal protein S27E